MRARSQLGVQVFAYANVGEEVADFVDEALDLFGWWIAATVITVVGSIVVGVDIGIR
jgi:hypothetical protein